MDTSWCSWGAQIKKQPVRDLVIDEFESTIVKEIFHKIVSDGWGANRVANWLNEEHITTKRKKPFGEPLSFAFWYAIRFILEEYDSVTICLTRLSISE